MDAKDLRVGDVVRFTGESNAVFTHGKEYDVVKLKDSPLLSDNIDRASDNIDRAGTIPEDIETRFEFVRRPSDSKYIDPKIAVEKAKTVCVCCTREAYGSILLEDDQEAICHDDPCQYTHLERDMLPKAKAMFRDGQFKKATEAREREQYQKELRAIGLTEPHCSLSAMYWKLVGREPKLLSW